MLSFANPSLPRVPNRAPSPDSLPLARHQTSKIASKYGAFSDVGFLSSGEPYNDKDPCATRQPIQGPEHEGDAVQDGKDERRRVRQTQTSVREGEVRRGDDPGGAPRRAREAREAGRIQPPLKPPSKPRTRTSGLGSYDGSIGPAFEHAAHGDPEARPKVKRDIIPDA